MTKIILIIIGVVIIAVLLSRKSREKIVGICATALDQTVRKKANKAKVVTLLAEKGELSNSDIREALNVSDRSVIRYMDELEREGKVEQMGNTGRGVVYRLKP